MNTNHLSLMRDTSEENNHVRYQQNKSEQQQFTLSDIAERLRLLSNQMKSKPAFKTMQNITPFPHKEDQGINGYLDDIARALLAEYHARRNSHCELLAHLEQIKHDIAATKKGKNEADCSDSHDLIKETAEQFGERLRLELAAQTKTFIAENQKSNQEISRQLQETVETSRFASQLISLQKQITNIQAKLNAHNIGQKSSSFENKTQTVASPTFPKKTNVPSPEKTENQENTNIRTFDKSVICRLATKKIIASQFDPSGKLPPAYREGQPMTCKISDENKQKNIIQSFKTQAEKRNLACPRTIEENPHTAKCKKTSVQYKFRKIFTRVSALFLIGVLTYNLKVHFNMPKNASSNSFIR